MGERGEVESQISGLSSTKYFKSILKYLSDFSRETSMSLSVLKFRVSNLDKIGNAHSSASQDKFFIHMAALISSKTRKSDLVGKLDEDVFYLVAPKCTKANLEIISDRLQKNFVSFLDEKQFPPEISLDFKYFEYDYNAGSLEKLIASELIF